MASAMPDLWLQDMRRHWLRISNFSVSNATTENVIMSEFSNADLAHKTRMIGLSGGEKRLMTYTTISMQ